MKDTVIENELGVVTVQDLINVCHDTYKLHKNPDAQPIGIPGFELVKHEFDRESHHSGVAYYQEQSGTLVMGHRGSATARDWLVTDVGIALNAKETKSDLAAIRFAESVLDRLDRENKPVHVVIETGHSKGGRESQTVLRHICDQGQGLVQGVGLTFNSARVHKTKDQVTREYDHVNLQVTGGSKFSTDAVSAWGSHLGEHVKIVNPEVKTFVGAHGMAAVEGAVKSYKNMEGLDVRNFVQGVKNRLPLDQITNENTGQKRTAEEIIKAHHQFADLVGDNVRSTKGKIIGETETQSIQQLGERSKFFKIHEKRQLTVVPKVGDEVKISYSSHTAKASVETMRVTKKLTI